MHIGRIHEILGASMASSVQADDGNWPHRGTTKSAQCAAKRKAKTVIIAEDMLVSLDERSGLFVKPMRSR